MLGMGVNMKWKTLLLTFIILTNLLLNGCMGSKEINTLSLAISLGIDKSDKGYSVTYQILNPKAIESNKSANESPFFLYTESGKDLFEIFRKVTTISPRKIYNSHLRMIVFSEEIAKEGIQSLLDFFLRDHEFRTDFYFIVAKGSTANEVLKTITPLESVSGLEMYNSLETSEKAWAPTKAVKIIELVNSLIADGKNPVLSSVELVKKNEKSDSIDALKQSVVSKLKISGLCAFKKDKLVGCMSEDESKGYNYITNNVKNTVGYVQLDEQNKITVEVIKSKSKTKAYMLKGKPAINVEVNLTVNIAAQTGTFDVSTEENTEKICRLSEEKIGKICKTTIKRVQEDLGSDIFGFGEEIHRTYPKLWKKLKDDWNNKFAKLPTSVTVHIKVNGLGECTKSVFSKGK
jgi:spore germination protein KC